MRQMEMYRIQSDLNEETPCTLVYYVIIDELTDDASGIQLEVYGVGIAVCGRDESAYIPNVTFNKTAILELAALLAEYAVTPVTARDVVEDWLCA